MTRDATHTMTAWSCTMRIVVSDERYLSRAVSDLTGLLERVDQAASRFRADSALSIANGRAGRPTPVPMLLVELVAAALDAAADTDGAVDPTVGRSLHSIGYDRDFADVERDDFDPAGFAAKGAAPTPRLRRRTWRDVRLDRSVGLLTVPIGTSLDLGATAKAFTADLAARTISRRYGVAALVELGGDIAVGGDRPDGWRIRVAEREAAHGQLVTIHRGGLATSTTTIRRWRRGGRLVHHIVDPRTGLPADGPWRTVSVYGPTALAANTASTAAIVLGRAALPWLAERDVAARLLGQDGSPAFVGDWPRDQHVAVA